MSRNKIQFGRPKKAKQKLSQISITIDNLSLEGRGVARVAGKTIFVEGAIPGESLTVKIERQHKNYDEASILAIDTPSEHRIDPSCEHYNHCGGCQLQHIEPTAQLAYKQQAVLSLLERSAKIIPADIVSPLISKAFHYRRTARIGVNRLTQSQRAIVGFRRKNSSKLLQISSCIILPEHLADLFDHLRDTLDKIDNAKAITHVEYLQGDDTGALTFRVVAKLSPASCDLLADMLQTFKLQGFLRYNDSLVPLANNQGRLNYTVSQQTLSFEPGDFLQVNAAINQQMIDRATDWLALTAKDTVLDLFAGLGNISLPVAKQVKQLIGVEGSASMVRRATDNAEANHIDNCQFFTSNLSQDIQHQDWFNLDYNKVILDPPRSGASDLIKQLLQSDTISEHSPVTHILYIACDPSSLARDAKLLKSLGYQMDKFSVMDMFPNTAHIESMALFTPATKKPQRRKSIKLFSR